MAARPSAFRAAQTARWESNVGTTPTGSGSKSTRRDVGQACANRLTRIARRPGRRTTTMAVRST